MEWRANGRAAPAPGTGFALLLAASAGLSVANVYYAQPLLARIGPALHVGAGELGLTTTGTQVGYLLGLVLIVPLGDLVSRRGLIVAQALAAAAGLAAVGMSVSVADFLVGSAVVGMASCVVQVIVAYAAQASPPARRGQTVGIVTSGVVMGILLARTVSGLAASLLGWRGAFLLQAAAMLAMAAVLSRLLPAGQRRDEPVPYLRAISSVCTLATRDRTFLLRSVLGLLMFAGFGALWGSVALPLSAAPWRLTTGQVGLFGIVGVAGALGASSAGRQADRGHAQRVTGLALVLLPLSWAAIAAAPRSLVLLAVGMLVLDFAGQSLHVTNQHLIVAGSHGASSRIIGSYMVFYSVGTGGGAIAATSLYSLAGWGAVAALGASLSILALLVWGISSIRSFHEGES
jgi:predicted MFS family arabinose efflux permease